MAGTEGERRAVWLTRRGSRAAFLGLLCVIVAAPALTCGGDAGSSPTVTPTPVATQAATTPEQPLTSAELFRKVSPAIAFVETEITASSGVLIEGGFVVTNAHVVWPYDVARVVLPSGAEFNDVPVLGWDLPADIAVLGPIDTNVAPLALVDGEDLPIGAEVFLIGYPGEVEAFPQPTLSSGLLSRTREWEEMAITFLQSDAVVAGGQSGGALLSESGGVIGISGFSFTDGRFALAASAADILPRVQALTRGGDPSGLGDRRIPLDGGRLRHEVVFDNPWDGALYVFDQPVGTTVEFELSGDNDGLFEVFDSFSALHLSVDGGFSGIETGVLETEATGPHFVRVAQFDEGPGGYTLRSSHRSILLPDPDDGKQVRAGETLAGNIDAPGDLDYFVIDLEAGETIEIRTTSLLVDTQVGIDFPGAVELTSDDDSGGGLFGVDAALTYEAPHSGSYFVIVTSFGFAGPGGYVLTVSSVATP